jgi:hypothetical protein
MKSLLVDTVPKDARNRGSINLGFEIVRKKWTADICHWGDKVNASDYDRIGFNVFYATHMLNVGPFLRRNSCERGLGPRLVVGGQGIGWRGAMAGIVDDVFTGEIDAECAKEITSDPIIKDGKAVVELSRGCRHRCGFCEYAHNHGLRFKPLALALAQVDAVADAGCRRINFMSTDFGGYPHLDDLMEHSLRRGIQILNGDYCVTSVPKVLKWLKYLPRQLKLGVESFYEPARRAAGKRFSDDQLEETVSRVLEVASAIHFYLIYGLPGDDYGHWFRWLEKLTRLRDEKHTGYGVDLFGDTYKENMKNVRFEFNITNFEPCDGTPLADAPVVDFEKKAQFIRQWSDAMIRNGLFVGERMDYVNAGGRIGRKELSYRMLMALKRGGAELSDGLMNALPNGVGRSISDDEAGRFLEYAGVVA